MSYVRVQVFMMIEIAIKVSSRLGRDAVLFGE